MCTNIFQICEPVGTCMYYAKTVQNIYSELLHISVPKYADVF